MLRVILISIFIIVMHSAIAQVQTQVIGDSVFIHSNTGSGELILQNSTDTVNGFLFNMRAGRTEFRKALIKINDSTYLVGADTLHLNGGNGNAWSLKGNTGTNPDSNFIGTKDNQPLFFKVNNGLSGMIGTASTYNTSYGLLSLSNSSTGIRNAAFGASALAFNTTGYYNSAYGHATLYNNTTGYRNTAIGYESLYHNKVGHDNVAVGWSSQGWDSSGVGNTSVGSESKNQAGSVIHTGGSYNSGFGFGALGDNWNNSYNIGIGKNAGLASTKSNTFYISDSTYHMVYRLDSATGTAPSVIGKDSYGSWHVYTTPTLSGSSTGWALNGNSGTNYGTDFIGTTDNVNLEFKVRGVRAGLIYYTDPGNVVINNTSFGANSFPSTATSTLQTYGNSAFGGQSLGSATNCFWNSAFGSGSLASLTTGSENTAVGGQALSAVTTEGYNTAVGRSAANTMVGLTNTTSLGYSAQPTASNQVVLGNNSVTQVLTYGNVLSKVAVKASDPTATDVPDGFTAVFRNSTTGNVYLWANVGGTLLKTQLQ